MSVNPNDPTLQSLLGGAGSLTTGALPGGTGAPALPVYSPVASHDIDAPAGVGADPQMLAALEQAIQEEAVIAGINVTPGDIQQWAQTAASDPNLTQLWPDIAAGTLSLSSFTTYARDFIRQQYLPAISNSVTSKEYAKYGITDRTEETVYSPVRSLWETYFGREPTTQQLQDVIAHGSDPTTWEQYIRSLPGPVQGYSIGTYSDVRKTADQVSQKIYGHPANTAITADLLKNNAGSQSDVQSYYDNMQFQPGKHVDPTVYNHAYQANLPIAAGLTNDYPHPLAIRDQLASLGHLNELTPAEQGNG